MPVRSSAATEILILLEGNVGAVPDPLARRDELTAALELVAAEAEAYLGGLRRDPVQPPDFEAALGPLGGALPEDGEGAPEAIAELARAAGRRPVGAGGGSSRQVTKGT